MNLKSIHQFGVEIEHISNYTHSDLKSVLSRKGIPVFIADYREYSLDHYVVKSDGSLSPSDRDIEYDDNGDPIDTNECGIEVCSPVFNSKKEGFEKKLEDLHEVLFTLSDRGYVNRTCGLHVHIDCGNLTLMDLKKIYQLFISLEDQLSLYLPYSRRCNSFTSKIKGGYSNFAGSILNADRKKHLNEQIGSRYYGLSFSPLGDKGTIEFRYHSGTLDYDKIINWILILDDLIHYAINRPLFKGYADSRELSILKCLSNDTRDLFLSRVTVISGSLFANLLKLQEKESLESPLYNRFVLYSPSTGREFPFSTLKNLHQQLSNNEELFSLLRRKGNTFCLQIFSGRDVKVTISPDQVTTYNAYEEGE